MDLYIAIRGKNRGNIYDLTDEGLEELNFREKTKGQLTPAGYQGLIVPFNSMKDELIKLPRRGQVADIKLYEHFNNK